MILFDPAHSRSYFDAERLNRTILEEFSADDDRPFMLYVHYIEPHTPYYSHPYRPVQITPVTRKGMYSAYRQELNSVDKSISDLYEFLGDGGMLDNTWILVTSDHGEEFYDHGNWGHGKSLNPEVLRVPAILIAPRNRPGGRAAAKVPATIESIDIAPTFASLAGVSSPDYWEGTSLAPLLSGSGVPAPDTALAQFNDGHYLWASAVVGEWQIIFREPSNALDMEISERLGQRKTMIFNLANDSLAKEDLYGQEPEQAAELVAFLEEALFRLETSAALFQSGEEAVDEENLKQLRALGYLD
jgi:arylsulfatase A-like enzyme